MDQPLTPFKKIRSPGVDASLNLKTSVTCVGVPDELFDASTAKKHFGKFGRVQRIRLFPKKRMCIIEYDQPASAERAVLNAGAYDGFMFNVARSKNRLRKRSKKEDDPDWVPDPDVAEELKAMGGAATYSTRQKSMDLEVSPKPKMVKRVIKQSPVRSKLPVQKKIISQPVSGTASPVSMTLTQTSLSTSEAAAELHQLRFRVSLTPDEQWRTLDARDRLLRAWGGSGSRVRLGGATIGTCQNMCPEKELLHRQAEHQVMTLETDGSDGQLDPRRAVKQYSRSSADQEMPLCYELRPAASLARTMAYLLLHVADTNRQVTLADWFHFMWDRLRGIRKDITQQALCCAESIRLVEMCARFHAHCAARLADLDHTQFDQKLNTDNLTKCLQTLKHMYADVESEKKPLEAEFRGYIALLNLGDANFWWEIKQLPLNIQKSEPIMFAIKVFNALDNNNYVRFFRLVKERATYLQACILLRYFNDVRARALARIVKAFAPRGGSRYPAEEIMNSLAFETVDNMRSFINHYGLRVGKDETELTVILDRNQFIEDMDPYPVARALSLIESKRQVTVAQVIAGGPLPFYDSSYSPYTSFTKEGKLKDTALIAEDQGYDTINDTNKNVEGLRIEIRRLAQGGKQYNVHIEKPTDPRSNVFVKPDVSRSPGKSSITVSVGDTKSSKLFSFKPAIPVAPVEVINNSPEKVFGADSKNTFSFSKPDDTGYDMFAEKDVGNNFTSTLGKSGFVKSLPDNKLFSRSTNENQDPAQKLFKQSDVAKTIFGQAGSDSKFGDTKNVFGTGVNNNSTTRNTLWKNIFATPKEELPKSDSAVKFDSGTNIFAKAAASTTDGEKKPNIFSDFKPTGKNLFSKPDVVDYAKPSFFPNGESNKLSPGTLFKTANIGDGKGYSIFQSKNKPPSVAENIFNSVTAPPNNVFDFDANEDETKYQLEQERLNQEAQRKLKEEDEKKQELKHQEEIRRQEEQRLQEELKRKEEERRKLEEMRRLEERRKQEEERKQEELKRKLDEERKAELKRKAEEEEKKFRERVIKESNELIESLCNEITDETLKTILCEEVEKMKALISSANSLTEVICTELCDEISRSEMTAEKHWTDKLMRKWFYIWKKQLSRNFKRRRLLDDTPVWLTENTAFEEATNLRRPVEQATLKNMQAVHRGYRFKGELRLPPTPEPYNIMDIIKSPLLKRMKQIHYPYGKCIFWKVTLISPGESKWLCKKIDLEKWIIDVFSDKAEHETSESLIRVQKQSWNCLIDFAFSVSLTNESTGNICSEAMEGSNALVFYVTENDNNIIKTIENTLKYKHAYHMVPVAVILPQMKNPNIYNQIQELLNIYKTENIISDFKMILLDEINIPESLNASSKLALRWLAKKYPLTPPLEVDYLKSLCQRYLGNEIWCRLKVERDSRMNIVLKDLQKLVQCYNTAVDKLIDVLTNEDLFNYSSFPLEFSQYLDQISPYPKSYEFIPTNARNSDNISAIKSVMNKLKLPHPRARFEPLSVGSMQEHIRKYCYQIGWFDNPEEVVCKVVALLPNEFSDLDMPYEEFNKCFENYDLIDFLNIVVYENISRLNSFDNRFAVYEKAALEEYRNMDWFYSIQVMSNIKHKAIEYEDEFDEYIETKRRKLELDSMEHLMLEDRDCTVVEENIRATNDSIAKYSNCTEAVKQLEEKLEEERVKSLELENLLRRALANV